MSALEELAKKAAEAAAKNTLAATETAKVAEERTFYSNISGSTYIFANGDFARFTNGVYVTNREFEIKELDALVRHPGNHHVYDHEVDIQNPQDALILREVGKGGGVGMVSSANLAALTALQSTRS